MSKDKTVLIAGAGAVENAWNPVIRAATPENSPPLSPEVVTLQMAALVYNCRLNKFGQQNKYCEEVDRQAAMLDYHQFRKKLGETIREAQANQELKPRKEFDSVVQRFLISKGDHWDVINLNWDSVIDKRLWDIMKRPTKDIFHLHGDCEITQVLYLPSETSFDYFREEDERQEFLLKHAKVVELVEQACLIILYGVSLSPLDAELATVLMMGFMRTPFKRVVVIDPNHEAIVKLVRGLELDDPKNRFVQSVVGIAPVQLILSDYSG